MRVAVIGGGLQGVELCLLARLAGWQALLVDRRPEPSARHLADTFHCADVRSLDAPDAATAALARALSGADILLPALEDAPALAALTRFCRRAGLPLAHDPAAYAVSSSKLRSRELFMRCGTPIPRPADSGPETAFPLIIKPSAGSGSRGVRLVRSREELLACLPQGADTPGWVVEAYCPGRQYSLEICGTPGHYRTFQLTELLLDDVFDCRGVLAPVEDAPLAAATARELLRLAERLKLRGLMDVEVIAAPDGLRVLEIDARFPSQTPLTVWLSTGVNLAEQLAACFVPHVPAPGRELPRPACYLHVARQGGDLFFPGEHDLAQAGPLQWREDIPGALGMLIGGSLRSRRWSAVLLLAADTAGELVERRDAALAFLRAV